MPIAALQAAVQAVDWHKNVADFLTDTPSCEKIAISNKMLSLWSYQIEMEESGNPALSFLREMQVSGQHVAALTALALYKPASAAMRTVVESALYYSYFRTHHAELATLVRSSKYYTDKYSIIEYHKEHTAGFGERQQALGLLTKLNPWYSKVSAIVHGQIPGSLSGPTDLSAVKQDSAARIAVAELFEGAVEIVNYLVLSTFAPEIWHGVSKPAKKAFLQGLSGAQKTVLQLDAA